MWCRVYRAFDPLQVSREQSNSPNLGQRIDTSTGEVERIERPAATTDTSTAGEAQTPEAAHSEAVARFSSELRTKSLTEVVSVFRAAQAQRVTAYGEFDASLATMLESGVFDSYGSTCAVATATFSNCSANAVATKEVLEETGAVELAKIIAKVQVSRASASNKPTILSAFALDATFLSLTHVYIVEL